MMCPLPAKSWKSSRKLLLATLLVTTVTVMVIVI